MPFEKGVNKTGGRKKGIPNMITADIRNAYRMFVEGRIDKLDSWMDEVASKDPDKALDFVLKFSEYFIPKLARTEIVGDDGKDFVIKVINYADSKGVHSEKLSDESS